MADANVSQLEINGTTYDICDATARDSLSQYVLKSGDTITGNLTIQTFDTGTEDSAEGGYLFLKNNYINSRMGTTWPSTNEYFNGIIVADVNGDHIRYDETAKTATGALYRSICLKRSDINGENPVINGLYLHINDDGTREVDVTDPQAWREAILAVKDAPGMYTNMEIPATNLPSQLGLLKFKCKNSGATTYNNHVLTTIFSDGGLSLFDSTAAKMLWEFNYAHALVYKGAFPYTDFNNYTVPTGIYHLDGTTRTNGPSQGYTWSHMIIIAESTWQTQIIIAGYNMYIRKRTGSPATWANWTTLA